MLTCIVLEKEFIRQVCKTKQHQSISCYLGRNTYIQHSKRVRIKLTASVGQVYQPWTDREKSAVGEMYHAHF